MSGSRVPPQERRHAPWTILCYILLPKWVASESSAWVEVSVPHENSILPWQPFDGLALAGGMGPSDAGPRDS